MIQSVVEKKKKAVECRAESNELSEKKSSLVLVARRTLGFCFAMGKNHPEGGSKFTVPSPVS
jgi:hypothetical protein